MSQAADDTTEHPHSLAERSRPDRLHPGPSKSGPSKSGPSQSEPARPEQAQSEQARVAQAPAEPAPAVVGGSPVDALSAPGSPAGPGSPGTVNTSPVIVKKYANRRLYNTESSSYITLDTLADMVRNGRDFVVYDAKTAEDITRSVLTQIIVEEESKGRALLPTAFLRQLIGFYGDSMQTLVPKYLEQAMASFARQQESVRAAMQSTLGNFLPFGIEEVSRQNRAMMERAMTLFSPFTYREGEDKPPFAADPEMSKSEREVLALRAEVEALRKALAQVNERPGQQVTGQQVTGQQVIGQAVPDLAVTSPKASASPDKPSPASTRNDTPANDTRD